MAFLEGLYPVITKPTPRPPRNGRPNYNQIHAKPLPLDVYPLPPLIPHNPLSILHIAFTYIFQLLKQPSSQPNPKIRGYYSSATNSVHITDPTSIDNLWQHGFFGKGSLSRSEPTWLDREKKRLGILAADTSEENTAARREERRRFKNERARKEREVINEKLMEELLVDKIASSHKPLGPLAGPVHDEENRKPGKPTLRSKYEGLAEAALLSPTKGIGFFGGERMLPTPPVTPSLDSALKEPDQKEPHKPIANGIVETPTPPTAPPPVPPEIENQEHLQLTPEEAFFLTYALGILEIYPSPNHPPLHPPPSPLTTPALLTALTTTPTHPPNPSDPFLLSYTTYHHFRSLGWVVRPGLKFSVDYLLYLRGPVFSHAEFAVVIQPAYTHPFWKTSEGRRLRWRGENAHRATEVREEEEVEEVGEASGGPSADDQEAETQKQQDRQRSWHWLHCLQRVQSQVRKTLVVAWVDVPPPPVPVLRQRAGRGVGAGVGVEEEEEEAEVDITAMLRRYKVREMVIKRWIPNRSRD